MDGEPEEQRRVTFCLYVCVFYSPELSFAPQLMQPSASVQGLSYILKYTQSSSGCPCERKMQHTNLTTFKTYVSYSAVNISVVARNAAGYSPPAIIPIPAEPAEGLNCRFVLEWITFYLC